MLENADVRKLDLPRTIKNKKISRIAKYGCYNDLKKRKLSGIPDVSR